MINIYKKKLSKYIIKNINKKKIVIYTVLFGNYDILKRLECVCNKFELICFTNQPIKLNHNWKIIYIQEPSFTNIDLARLIKINPQFFFREFDESIYLDASILFKKDINDFYENYLKDSKFTLFKHPKRKCIYDEARVCELLGKQKITKLTNQIEFYKSEAYPKNNGLIASGVIYRHHNDPNIIQLMENWSKQILLFSKRDQISFSYSAWKLGALYKVLRMDIFKNEYFEVHEHNNKIKLSFIKKLRYIIYKTFG